MIPLDPASARSPNESRAKAGTERLAAERQGLILLGWLALRSNDTLRAGLQKIAAITPQATATTQLHGVISELREQVTVLAPVLTDERLAAAQLNEDAAQELNTEIARLPKHHTESFDAFFAAHPEAQRLISVIEAYRNPQPEDGSHTA